MQKHCVRKALAGLVSLALAGALVPVVPLSAAASATGESTQSVAQAGEESTSYVADEAIVVYEDDASKSEKAAVVAVCDEYGAEVETVIEPSSSSGDGAVAKVALDADSASGVDALIDDLNSTEGVAYAQRNHIYRTMEDSQATAAAETLEETETNDPRTSEQYFLDEWTGGGTSGTEDSGADVRRAWALAKNAANATDEGAVTIAELDTGVDTTHEDLVDNIDTEHMAAVSVGRNSYQVVQGECDDVDGHGTHVAGILAASTNNGTGIAGVSYNANLLPVRVFYRYRIPGYGYEYVSDSLSLIAACDYLEGLVDEGELTNLHVVNMSLGGYEADETDYALEEEIATLRDDYNVLTVCAGGNGDDYGNPITSMTYPGDFDEAFSVSWLDADGHVSEYADYNEYKDISAPGTDIVSTLDPTLGNGERSSLGQSYGTMSGSSMSAPLVSGVAALLWALEPGLTTDEVRVAMQQTAREIPDAPATLGSAGAVDAAAALAYAEEHFAVEGKARISAASVSSSSFPDSDEWYAFYTGSVIEPQFTLTLDGKELVEGQDYIVSYTNNTALGTATALFWGRGDYQGIKAARFSIVNDLGVCTVNSIEDAVYTGSAVEPTVTVSASDGSTLAQDTDYTVAFSNNTAIGRATVTLTGIGSYRGTLETGFWIVADGTSALSSAVTGALPEASTFMTANSAVLSADGSDVDPAARWVSQAAYDSMAAAVAAGQAVLDSKTASAEEVAAARQAILDALSAFEATLQAGTMGATTSSESTDRTATSSEATGQAVVAVTVNKTKVTTKVLKKAIGSNVSAVTTVTLGKKVKKISKGAFKKYPKITKLIVKSKKLTKKGVKGSLKGSKVKTVQVKVGSKKVNKKYVKKYKRFFTKKNCGRPVTVKR